jgi:hypothetical protein
VQAVHVFVAVSQMGAVGVVHSFIDLHCTHCPLAAQWGASV